MTANIKIGIVEDELIIAEKIKHLLVDIGYQVCEPVTNYDEALAMIKNESPDLLLLDINLSSKKDGIDIAKTVNERYHLPFIFLTANSDGLTLERAKSVKPSAYLVKPFTREELFASIEIAFNNYSALKSAPATGEKHRNPTDFIFIRENHKFVKVLFDEVLFVESRENYVVIRLKSNHEIMLRSTFQDFLNQLPHDKFYRVHRSYAVQTKFIENITSTELFASGIKIPISHTYRSGLLALLGIKE